MINKINDRLSLHLIQRLLLHCLSLSGDIRTKNYQNLIVIVRVIIHQMQSRVSLKIGLYQECHTAPIADRVRQYCSVLIRSDKFCR